jgi:hypothetical protein
MYPVFMLIYPKGGTMPGASASGLGAGCGTFSSPCIPSCCDGCGDDGCCNGDGGSCTCEGCLSVSSSGVIAVVFVVGVNDAP